MRATEVAQEQPAFIQLCSMPWQHVQSYAANSHVASFLLMASLSGGHCSFTPVPAMPGSERCTNSATKLSSVTLGASSG